MYMKALDLINYQLENLLSHPMLPLPSPPPLLSGGHKGKKEETVAHLPDLPSLRTAEVLTSCPR